MAFAHVTRLTAPIARSRTNPEGSRWKEWVNGIGDTDTWSRALFAAPTRRLSIKLDPEVAGYHEQ
jgi:hypothetical protein